MRTTSTLVKQLIGESNEFSVVSGHPATWQQRDGNFATIKASQPRGVPASVLKSLGFSAAWGDLKGVKAWTASGRPLDNETMSYSNYHRFKPNGLVLEFPEGTNAVEKSNEILGQFTAKAEKEVSRREKERAGAPERRKEMSKLYRSEYNDERQKLIDQFGKKNVDSVTAKQIGGDDGYQWTVLINGRQFVNGLTRGEVDGYKRAAYDDQLKRNGKV